MAVEAEAATEADAAVTATDEETIINEEDTERLVASVTL
jgi:hypothetical protein